MRDRRVRVASIVFLTSIVVVILGIFSVSMIRDRQWHARVDEVAQVYADRGSFKKADFWRMTNIGSEVARNGGKIADDQLDLLLSFPIQAKTRDAGDESPVSVAIRELVNVKRFHGNQASKVASFADEELSRPHSPMLRLLISKIGCRAGSRTALVALKDLARNPDPQVAQIATILQRRIALRRDP